MLVASILITAGVICIAAFLYLNLILQPKWFPQEIIGGANKATEDSRCHFNLGVALVVLMVLGVTLITFGCVEIGILTSRS